MTEKAHARAKIAMAGLKAYPISHNPDDAISDVVRLVADMYHLVGVMGVQAGSVHHAALELYLSE